MSTNNDEVARGSSGYDAVDMEQAPKSEWSANRRHDIRLPVFLMLWPLAVVPLIILLYALAAFLFEQPSSAENALMEGTPLIQTATNMILFILGAASVTIAPISFLTGLVMLLARLAGHEK